MFNKLSGITTWLLGRVIGHAPAPIGAPGPAHVPQAAAACAGDLYLETPAENLNGTLLDGSQMLGRYVGELDQSGDERPLFLVAETQFFFPGVKMLGRHLGEATVDGDTRPLFGVARCTHCLWAADYFERADSADIGDFWDEIAGSGAIAGGLLLVDNDDALIINKLPLPDNMGSFGAKRGTVTVTVNSSTVGAQAKVIGSWQDDDNYVYALWEFGASDGILSMYRVVAGTPSLERGPIHFASQGAGVATTIHLCWGATEENPTGNMQWNVTVDRPADDPWRSLRATLVILGAGHGVGTGDVAGGDVTFDDYKVELNFHQKGDAANCPDCRVCHACPDDQELCLHIRDDYGNIRILTMARQTGHGWPGTASPYQACDWGTEDFAGFVGGVVQGGEDAFAAYLYLQANGYWLFLVVGEDGVVWIYVFDDLPECDEWSCLQMRLAPFGIVFPHADVTPAEFDYLQLAPAAISSGPYCPDCYLETEEGQCCGGVSLPGTLYMTILHDGVPYLEDWPLNGGQTGDTFLYTDGATLVLECSDGVAVASSSNPAQIPEMELTILSCSPFHATGSIIVGFTQYDVEITQ